MNPFQQNNNFEKKDSQTPFGQGNTPFGTQNPQTPFGQQQPAPAPFGSQPINFPFGNQSTSPGFGSQNTSTLFNNQSNSPFGNTSPFKPSTEQSNPPFGSQPSPFPSAQNMSNQSIFNTQGNSTLGNFNPSGNMPMQPSNLFGSNTPSLFPSEEQKRTESHQSTPVVPFGASVSNLTNPSNVSANDSLNFPNTQAPVQNSLFNTPSSLFESKNEDQGKMFNKTENESSFKNVADQSSLLSAVKDNSLNLYNLTLQEIIDRHSAILDANISEFEKDAKSVFERDLKLIRSKNNYLEVQKKIAEENSKLDELSQVLDFFSQRIDEIETGELSDGAKIVNDFEEICAKFYEKIESFKDDQDEVLDLVNENYEIIENIDKKLDLISQIKNINK